ncbi:glycoside hydrolase family 95 protein [Paenibacillus sp. ACRRY]|uniref:glycoside hydrolase family 95 protein n=1 Tax=Paenibacillus sp. ACRRY TaxID=2918208 RepID=UPI001EF4965C|nr:glycoside hydrolase family 95 protein [Paenibacillus sp. ACRRY]MCG7381312.1 glycoside hydrolase family 95 protein [Paenibacillus sp. ACRRY]
MVNNDDKIWYNQPAERWEEAMPMGNGTLGGMVYGRTDLERIQLNEDSLWYGGPMERNNPDTLDHLSEIRELVFNGKIQRAEELATTYLVGIPDGQRHYEPLGDLYLVSGSNNQHIEEYRRELDLKEGVVRLKYRDNGVPFFREYFSSFPDQVLVIRQTSSNPYNLSLLFGRGSVLNPTPWSDILKRPVGFHSYLDNIRKNEHGDMVITGRSGGEGGIRFCCLIRVLVKGGSVSYAGGQVKIEQTNDATILVSSCTDFRMDAAGLETECLRRVEQASDKTYQQLRTDHVRDYQNLYNRVKLSLEGHPGSTSLAEMPIDVRLRRIKEGHDDPGLVGLYFQFGRYLLISSSRPGALPANLQGIWNKDMLPIWDSKYTININTQMNYWLAESCNLSECHIPLFDFIERLRKRGTETAKVMYGCRGFVAHHNSDLWADTAPQDVCITSTFWTMGAAWLSLHLWDHYEFGRDVEFLKKAYETMKEAALFLLDYLVEDPLGNLVTCPSSSPENRYLLPSGESGALCYGPSMDSQIIRELFQRCIESSEILQLDQEFSETLKRALERIPRPAIGKFGQIQEWSMDYDELEPGHRHISHLFALHPGSQISLKSTPNFAGAAQTTLERRLQNGGGHTGWSRAWILNMWARLEDEKLSYDNVMELLRTSTLPNLFCDHPPFQIDGNFGGTAGIAEMLLQSHAGEIRLLPALPKQWLHGYVRGLRARGGFEIEMEWKDGFLKTAKLRSLQTGAFTVSYLDKSFEFEVLKPESVIDVSEQLAYVRRD